MLDLASVLLIDDHSHAGLYERRLQRCQTLADLDGRDDHYRTSAYRALLRQAYADLFGDSEHWAHGIDAQYGDGVEPAYTRMLDRLGIQATLWDFRRLVRDDWPEHRYRLIYWIDPFICPFPDPSFRRGEELHGALQEALQLAGRTELPDTFDEYLEFVESILRRARPRLYGLKLLLGYQRSLHFENVRSDAAAASYSSLRGGNLEAYTTFQDYMARRLYRFAGELDLPLQIHASFSGPSANLQILNDNPALLQPLLGDPEYRATKVVLLHGGYPYTSTACALAWDYQQLFLDWSVLASLFALPLARWLEEWIELTPANKLLFGTDASSPELYYTASVNGRKQLGVALDNLIAGGVLTRHEAVDVADRICHRNAIDLYRLDDLR
jgi:hypothetical protein